MTTANSQGGGAAQASLESALPLKVAIRIFDERERRHLSQILLLAAQRSPGRILTVSAADAEVVLINPEEPGSALFIRNAQRGKRPLPVIYGGEPEPGLPWLAKPARSNDVIDLLNRLPGFLDAVSSDSAGETVGDDLPPLIPTHDFNGVLSRLHGIRRQEQPVLINTGQGEILVDPRPGTAYVPRQSAGDKLTHTYAGMASMLADAIRPVSRAELVERIASFRHDIFSLEELGWSLSLLARPVEPAPAALMQKRFRLRHWPNFARLEHTQLHLIWAGMLIRQPLDLSTLLARSPQGFAPLARFYNGCALAGLLVHSDQVRGQSGAQATDSRRSGIFKRLLDRLAG